MQRTELVDVRGLSLREAVALRPELWYQACTKELIIILF